MIAREQKKREWLRHDRYGDIETKMDWHKRERGAISTHRANRK